LSRLTDFTRGDAPDAAGRMISEIWAFSDRELESVHDFIQWIFPLREASRFNADAPLVRDGDIEEFRSDPGLLRSLLRSFDVYLAFLGLAREGEGEGVRIVPAADFDRKKSVFRDPNHNWLRITRVLASTRMLGLEHESRAFFAYLEPLRATIDPTTFRYWQDAATG
jgi:hypothetical protein